MKLPVHRGESAVGTQLCSKTARCPTHPKARELFQYSLVLGRKKDFERPSLLSICLVGIGIRKVDAQLVELAQGARIFILILFQTSELDIL